MTRLHANESVVGWPVDATPMPAPPPAASESAGPLPALLDFFCRRHWAMHEPILRAGLDIVARHSAGIRLTADEIERITAAKRRRPAEERRYNVIDGTAIIPVSGVIAKYARMLNDVSQPRGTSIETLTADLDAALADRSVESILLHIESPGGSIGGLADFADRVYAASQRKPVIAYADDLAASAAYWIGSQASRFYAGQSSEVGSIGVYSILVDSSAWAANEGLRVHLIRSGPNKGVGAGGVPISNENLAVEQELIDQHYQAFLAAVMRGRSERGLTASALSGAADGRVFIAARAVELRLIDAVRTLPQAITAARPNPRSAGLPSSDLEPAISIASEAKGKSKKETAMPTTQTVEPQTAADPAAQNTQAPAEQPNAEAEGKAKSLQDARAALSAAVVEMKAAFPNDLEFALDAAARGLSVQAAKAEAYDAILGRLTAELETVRGELAEARKRLEVVAKGGVHGPTPRPSDSRGEGVPAGDDGQPETYESAVAGFKADGKTASQAHREAILRFPRATAAWRAAQPEYDRS